MAIPVIDVFAGPGGLNEGFSSVYDGSAFDTKLSIEMEDSAIKTLILRATMRGIRRSNFPPSLKALDKFLAGSLTIDAFYRSLTVSQFYLEAAIEVQQFTLSEESRSESDQLIRERLAPSGEGIPDNWVLIGGPPCQAYSLAGRSRRTKDETFEADHKHFLFKEYLHIIQEFKPSVFVMENVKGMLSSTNGGRKIFELLQDDLKNFDNGLQYNLHSMVVDPDSKELQPQDFLIKSEQYGIPQKRHRVILVGVRSDLGDARPELLQKSEPVTVRDAIFGLPELRSGVSKPRDPNGELWDEIWSRYNRDTQRRPECRTSDVYPVIGPNRDQCERLHSWLTKRAPARLWNHESRAHMDTDLDRYALLAIEAKKPGFDSLSSPKMKDLPQKYWPNHKNFGKENTPFEDRFRVQVWDTPSTTIVSHISKDGHYYIHPDPKQMRSLTVREAARLQTFPDDYIFLGNRTQQYTQVGNAVPPLLANQIGESIATMLNKIQSI